MTTVDAPSATALVAELGLTPEELAAVATLEQRVKDSAQLIVRDRLEDIAVRFSRQRGWCDEFRVYGLRVLGLPRGPKVNWRVSAYERDERSKRAEYRDSDGLDCFGYTVDGWFNGFGPDGYNREGFDAEGYDRREGFHPTTGLNKYRFSADGWDREGFNRHGLDVSGYNREGRDSRGYDRDGYNASGFNRDGRDKDGYDRHGFNVDGVDREGLDPFGRSAFSFNGYGRDKDGYDRSGYHYQTGDVLSRRPADR
jgi:hypothetical protein